MKVFLTSTKTKIIQIALMTLFFLQIASRDISECSNEQSLSTSTCFNNIIKFDNYRAGQFEQDEDGNMFLLYSNSVDKKKRLFYGIDRNRRNYFDSGFTIETEINYSGTYSGERNGARNIFITLNVDGESKQYLFSISAGNPGNSLAELYEIKKNDISSSSKTITNFLEINEEVTSYQHSLFKLPNEDIYIFGCTTSNNINIIKFHFSSQNLDDGEVIDFKSEYSNYNNKVISLFLMEENNILVLFYIEEYDGYPIYLKKFYNINNNPLEELNYEQTDPYDLIVPENVMFIKGLWIKEDFAAFIYFVEGASEDNDEGRLNITQYNSETNQFKQTSPIEFGRGEMNFDLLTNEFIKLDIQTLVFITTLEKDASERPVKLYIILFDFNENLIHQETREYSYNLGSYYLKKEMAAFIYNDFLVLSSSYNPTGTSDDDLNSLLIFFGYPNGTDESIDISGYLNSIDNIGTDVNSNIYLYLKSKMKVENNIFNYKEVDLIKLVSNSDDIQFYGISDDGMSEKALSDYKFGEKHILKQDLNLRGINQDSYFDYQYIVKEADNSESEEDGRHLRNIQESGTSQFYYGRTNKLTFIINGLSQRECTYELLLNKQSCVTSGTDEEIITKVKEMITQYEHFSSTISVKLSNNQFIEISNDMKEKLFDKDTNLSWLDLGKCAVKFLV